MCGIAGYFAQTSRIAGDTAEDLVRSMTNALAHRGPDGAGVWVDERAGIGLGHRRLSIIDLSDAGRQPMQSANQRYFITYNGEVYNFPNLRNELKVLGHSFAGDSDTEVMLAAITQWGLGEAVSRFAGMFAFALWDRRENRLSLVRDRMGVKPLYWTRAGDEVLFASELKGLMAHPAWRPQLNREAVAGFLRYSYVPNPTTIFEGVHQLAPGTILHFQADGSMQEERYWDLREVLVSGAVDPFDGGDEDAILQLDTLLHEVVGARMISDVPLGAFLSGGIDSSLVVAMMQAQSSKPVRTFAIGFEEEAFNEAPFAKATARHLGTDHTELYVTGADAMDAVSSIPDWFDEPFADASQLPTYLLARLAREHVTVALSGDGGDELFGGYPRYGMTSSLWRRINQAPNAVRRLAGGALLATPEPWLDRLSQLLPRSRRPLSAGRKIHRAAGLLSLASADELHGRISEVWPRADSLAMCDSGLRFPTDAGLADQVESFLARMRYYDMRTYLPDDILVKVDRTSMAVSLEAREPLLDHRLVSFALRLPDRFLMRDGKSKWLLRKVLERYVPPSLFDRPKMGFSIPTGAWLRGPLREWGEALLSPARIRDEGTFDSAEVARLWSEHQSGRANRESILWNLLMFQAWRDRYRVT